MTPPFQVDPYGEEDQPLTDSEMQSSFTLSPPRDEGTFQDRLLRSLTGSISLRPLTIQIKGGVEF